MKLYAMSCGRLRGKKSIFIPSADPKEYNLFPVPVFLIMHPQGKVLFDTGPNPKVFQDPMGTWGGLAKAFMPIGDAGSGIVPVLAQIGVKPEDITYVVNSHLHFDHAGGNAFFPQSIFLVSAEELECARRPDLQGKGYMAEDWDRGLNYRPIKGETDIFADGRLVIYPMPGHTQGHVVLLVRLDNDGNLLLTGDSVPCRENYEQNIVGRNNLDDRTALDSIGRLRELAQRTQAYLIHGHDERQWLELKKAPEYYS